MWFFEVTQSNIAWLYNITLWKSSPGHYDEPCAAVRLQNNLQWNWLNLFPFLHEVCDWADLESRYLNKMMTHNYHGESLTYNLKNQVHTYFNLRKMIYFRIDGKNVFIKDRKKCTCHCNEIFKRLSWSSHTFVVAFIVCWLEKFCYDSCGLPSKLLPEGKYGWWQSKMIWISQLSW